MKTTFAGSHSILRKTIWAICFLLLSSLLFSPGRMAVYAQSPQAVILVTSDITSPTTWTAGNVYYIQQSIQVRNGAVLTIEGGAIVKFWVPYSPSTSNVINLSVTSPSNIVFWGTTENPVRITSGRDDSPDFGGDTNGDGAETSPAPGDWGGIYLVNRTDEITNLISRYSLEGIVIQVSPPTSLIAPQVHYNTFAQNECGLTFLISVNATGSIESVVENNTFSQNNYGLCTSLAWNNANSGVARPLIRNNVFSNNTVLPILLKGGGFPTYEDSNIFTGSPDPADKLGIGLSGNFYHVGTWPIVNDMPYVAVKPVVINLNATITIPAGSVLKFWTTRETLSTDPLPGLRILGILNFMSTSEEPIIFTSYHDDTLGGDTNGDNSDTEPYANDWASVNYVDNLLTTSPNPSFQNLSFRYAQNGLLYETTYAASVRRPNIINCSFIGNRNGIRLKSLNNVNNRIEPVLSNNVFERNGFIPRLNTDLEPGTPVFLENTVEPIYTNNTFSDNLHPAIGVTGRLESPVTWTAVPGDGLAQLPYLVHGGMTVNQALTLPTATVVKFNVNKFSTSYKSSLLAVGPLDIQGTEEQPIVFTSYYDDYLDDTSADAIPPTRTDWTGLTSRNSASVFSHTIFRYGDKALHLENISDTVPLTSPVTESTFEENNYGLYLNVQGDANIEIPVFDNLFFRNNYGLGTFARSTPRCTTPNTTDGISLPILSGNRFEDHAMFPLYYNGSASPTYVESGGIPTNTFVDNDHRAIALGGYFGGSHTYQLPAIPGDSNPGFNNKPFPYVVLADTIFDRLTEVDTAGNLVFKGDLNTGIHFYGTLLMDTAAGRENYFTSYRDDYYDDTNGTPSPNPSPAIGDWDGIYLHAPGTSSPAPEVFFTFSTIRYSDDGLGLYQDTCSPGALTGTVMYNTFVDNTDGMELRIESPHDINAAIANNSFVHNEYGLHTYSNPATNLSSYGSSNPYLQANNFTQHTGFPIYLQGSSNPSYDQLSAPNVFSSNIHKAIAVGGMWVRDATWTLVEGDSDTATPGHIFPYVIFETVDQWIIGAQAPTITIPANTIIKVNDNRYFYVGGFIDLQSSPGTEVIFTSYHDDNYGGNTDAATTIPTRTSWKTVWLLDFIGKTNHIHDVKAYYATAAFGIFHYGDDENTQILPTITRGAFEQNLAGIAVCIGWYKSGTVVYGGKANIAATFTDLTFVNNTYGVLTTGHNLATGIIYPTFDRVTFENTSIYPLYLGYTTYPVFLDGTYITTGSAPQVEGMPAFGEPAFQVAEEEIPSRVETTAVLDFSYLASPQELQATVPETGTSLLADTGLYPAVGLAGAWNNSGTLPDLPDIPYIVAGQFPLTVAVGTVSYLPDNNMTIGATNPISGLARVTVPAGSIFKIGKVSTTPLKIIVKGGLNLMSTGTDQIVFTSVHDDSAGGDTNKNGAQTLPHPGDWGEVTLTTSATEFKYTQMRYATSGLNIYFDGGLNQNINPYVHHNSFTNNTTGLTLSAASAGDIMSVIEFNRFNINTSHIAGAARISGSAGRLLVEIHNNDFLGIAGQSGITNLNNNGDINALNNYWGSSTGPHHATKNPAGTGTEVSDYVLFDPWLTAAVFPPPAYSIHGQVTLDTLSGSGLPGVTLNLSNGQDVLSDIDGYYIFDDLPAGPYTVIPVLTGYTFEPTYQVIDNLQEDVTVHFIAHLVVAKYTLSIDSITVIAPIGGSSNATAHVAVRLLGGPLLPGETVTVTYRLQDGSALKGVDYTDKTGTLTFQSGQPLVKYIDIQIMPIDDPYESKYFTAFLENPSALASIGVGAGTVTITGQKSVFIPLVRK